MAVDRGLEPYLGTAVWLEAHKQNPISYRPAEDATAWQRLGELTLALALQLLLPLLAILLATRTVSSEREAGTLRLLAAQGVPPVVLAWGKAIAVYSLLLALLLPVGLVLLLVLPATAEGVVLLLAYLLYLLVFVLVGVAISAWVRTTRTALAIGLGFWLINGFLLPRLATDVAVSARPLPSAAAFQAAIEEDLRNGIDGHAPQSDRDKALLQATLAHYQVDSIPDLPVNWDAIRMQAGEEYGNQVFDKHFGQLFVQYHQQQMLRTWAAVLAPGIAMQQLSMGLAGTDLAQHQRFVTQAEGYRRVLVAKMNHDLRDNSKTGDWDYLAPASLWHEVGEFRYEAPTLGWVLDQHTLSLGLLAAWLLQGAVAVTLAGGNTRLI